MKGKKAAGGAGRSRPGKRAAISSNAVALDNKQGQMLAEGEDIMSFNDDMNRLTNLTRIKGRAGSTVGGKETIDVDSFPASYTLDKTPTDQYAAIKAAQMAEARKKGDVFPMGPTGLITQDKSDIEYALKREKVARLIQKDAWINKMIDWTDPAQVKWLNELYPELTDRRLEAMRHIADLQKWLAEIAITGIQSREDLELLSYLKNVSLPKHLIHEPTGLPLVLMKPLLTLNQEDCAQVVEWGDPANNFYGAVDNGYLRLENMGMTHPDRHSGVGWGLQGFGQKALGTQFGGWSRDANAKGPFGGTFMSNISGMLGIDSWNNTKRGYPPSK